MGDRQITRHTSCANSRCTAAKLSITALASANRAAPHWRWPENPILRRGLFVKSRAKSDFAAGSCDNKDELHHSNSAFLDMTKPSIQHLRIYSNKKLRKNAIRKCIFMLDGNLKQMTRQRKRISCSKSLYPSLLTRHSHFLLLVT